MDEYELQPRAQRVHHGEAELTMAVRQLC
jgi:hypothetical protein